MSNKLYIASMEARSGKSVVALGVMELLSRRLNNIGFFRPVIPNVEKDNNIHLISSRYLLKQPYEAMYAFNHDQAQEMVADGKYDTLLKSILGKFKALESQSKRHISSSVTDISLPNISSAGSAIPM